MYGSSGADYLRDVFAWPRVKPRMLSGDCSVQLASMRRSLARLQLWGDWDPRVCDVLRGIQYINPRPALVVLYRAHYGPTSEPPDCKPDCYGRRQVTDRIRRRSWIEMVVLAPI